MLGKLRASSKVAVPRLGQWVDTGRVPEAPVYWKYPMCEQPGWKVMDAPASVLAPAKREMRSLECQRRCERHLRDVHKLTGNRLKKLSPKGRNLLLQGARMQRTLDVRRRQKADFLRDRYARDAWPGAHRLEGEPKWDVVPAGLTSSTSGGDLYMPYLTCRWCEAKCGLHRHRKGAAQGETFRDCPQAPKPGAKAGAHPAGSTVVGRGEIFDLWRREWSAKLREAQINGFSLREAPSLAKRQGGCGRPDQREAPRGCGKESNRHNREITTH